MKWNKPDSSNLFTYWGHRPLSWTKKIPLSETFQNPKISEFRGWSLFLLLCLVQFSRHLSSTHSARDPKWLTRVNCLLSKSLQCNVALPYSPPHHFLSLSLSYSCLRTCFIPICLKCPHLCTCLLSAFLQLFTSTTRLRPLCVVVSRMPRRLPSIF